MGKGGGIREGGRLLSRKAHNGSRTNLANPRRQRRRQYRPIKKKQYEMAALERS
jgi:hypothetical protein